MHSSSKDMSMYCTVQYPFRSPEVPEASRQPPCLGFLQHLCFHIEKVQERYKSNTLHPQQNTAGLQSDIIVKFLHAHRKEEIL